MATSRIFIALITLLSVLDFNLASKCDENGLCKYGGVCGPDNQCRCAMRCNTREWMQKFDFYCLPRKGASPQMFLNLCFVLVEACERQEDIPLIKYDFSTHRCEADMAISGKLCPAPQDFMGPCGGTTGTEINPYEGGICLRDFGITRCICPPGKRGEKCNEKLLDASQGAVSPINGSNTSNIIGVSIGASVAAGVLIFALIRWRRSKKSKRDRTQSRDEESVAIGCNKACKSNRAESAIRPITNEEFAIQRVSETNSTASTPTKSRKLAASEPLPRRQRLKETLESNLEDANNNLGSSQPILNETKPLYVAAVNNESEYSVSSNFSNSTEEVAEGISKEQADSNSTPRS